LFPIFHNAIVCEVASNCKRILCRSGS
jgi:hypothetical protein